MTAEKVCGIINYPIEEIIYLNDLHELSQGEWEGRNRNEIYTADLIRRIEENPWAFKAPGGESLEDGAKRMVNVFDRYILLGEHDEKNIGVVGHGLAFKYYLTEITRSNPAITTNITIDNCSITQLEYNTKRPRQPWKFVKTNENAHVMRVGYS